jgi:ribonuclease J
MIERNDRGQGGNDRTKRGMRPRANAPKGAPYRITAAGGNDGPQTILPNGGIKTDPPVYVRPGNQHTGGVRGKFRNNKTETGGRPPLQGARRPASGGSNPSSSRNSRGGERGSGGRIPLRKPRTSGLSGKHFEEARVRTEEMRHERQEGERKKHTIPPLAPGDVRVIVLGGVEEIGRNISAVEYGNDIVIIDCGFMFKDEGTPGVDYILANTEYLEERKDKIRGVFITHGHLDHIGGLPYTLPRIGNPPVYARNLTALLIQKRQDEFPNLPPIDLRIIETEDRVSFGDVAVRFFKVTHTIPDAMGVMVETPYGVVTHTGDLKLDHVGGVPTDDELAEYKKFEKEKVLLLMADSTNCQKPGFSIPEPTVHATVEELIKNSTGRVIIATFSSLLERIIKIIEFCDTHGKKLVVDGRSMKTNIELAQKAGLFKYKKGTLISIDEMENYPDHKIVMLVTGAQGDPFAVLMRAATKKHKGLKIREGDTVLFSSSVVPGNERAVQKLKDMLSRQGGKIVHYETSDVHSSGHAYRDEARWIISHINPKFFIPLHGYHYMLRSHTEIAQSTGIPAEHCVIPDDGSIIEIREKGTKFVKLPVSAPNDMVAVDGFAIGNMQEVVIRDRQMLAEDGIVVLVATVDLHTGKLMKSPDIIARGFVYVRESQDLLNQARLIIKKTVEDACGKGMKGVNFEYLKEDVRDKVGLFLYQRTSKQPMVIPVLLGI